MASTNGSMIIAAAIDRHALADWMMAFSYRARVEAMSAPVGRVWLSLWLKALDFQRLSMVVRYGGEV